MKNVQYIEYCDDGVRYKAKLTFANNRIANHITATYCMLSLNYPGLCLGLSGNSVILDYTNKSVLVGLVQALVKDIEKMSIAPW